jgi:hypothetical protein
MRIGQCGSRGEEALLALPGGTAVRTVSQIGDVAQELRAV